MGVLSFFEQFGELISTIGYMVVALVEGIVTFYNYLKMGMQNIMLFQVYLPPEISIGFTVLVSIAVIYLVVGR